MVETGSSRRPDLPLAVVIGAGGLSLVIARRLSQRWRVLLADIDETRAAAGAETLCGEGGDVRSIRCDVTDPGDVARLAQAVAAAGPFRALAHVAGLSPSLADFATIVRVNLLGPALVAEALRPLAGAGAAAVIVASLAAHVAPPSPSIGALLDDPRRPDLHERLAAALAEEERTPQRAYQLSKYGVLALCRRDAVTWGAAGARLCSISPGLIASPQGAIEFRGGSGKHAMLGRTPLAREGTMLEIADAVDFLLSDRASFISGTDLLVDGGLSGAMRS